MLSDREVGEKRIQHRKIEIVNISKECWETQMRTLHKAAMTRAKTRTAVQSREMEELPIINTLNAHNGDN